MNVDGLARLWSELTGISMNGATPSVLGVFKQYDSDDDGILHLDDFIRFCTYKTFSNID